MRKKIDVGVVNRKRFEDLDEFGLRELILKLDKRRVYLCYLLKTNFGKEA